MSTDQDLGALICMLNPYTNGSQDSMDPHVFVAANWALPNPNAAPVIAHEGAAVNPNPNPGPAPAAPTAQPDMTGVWIEEDKQHPHWEFKQQPHRIAKAVRIAYRWPYTVGTQTVWMTDYVLIGFEGSNGDG
ncbi:MAG: hypothetical protein ACREE9_10365 [Stellaceae bacterium]